MLNPTPQRAVRTTAAALALIAWTTAAAFASPHQANAGTTPMTSLPDLVSVTLDPADAPGVREAAAFCFDAPLTAESTPDGFRVTGYDANRYLQGRATAPGVDPACVVITFDTAIDLRAQGSVGTVEAGAVRDLSGRPNPASGAPLTGSELAQVPGQTTGPDLLGAVGRPADDTVEFTFDQQVDRLAADIDASRFGVADEDGDTTAAASLVVLDSTGTKVRVRFPSDAPVGDAAAYFVSRGAVRSGTYDGVTHGTASHPYAPTTPFTLSPPGAVAGRTGSQPVLTSARRAASGGAQLVLAYSAELSAFDPAQVVAVLDNGEVEAAVSDERVADSPAVRLVAFPAGGAVDREPDAVVAVVAQSGASSGPPSAVPVGPGADSVPGRTNAPDLIGAALDPATSQASFVYDEPIDASSIGLPGSFALLGREGLPVQGIAQGVTTEDRRTVQIGYPGDIDASVGVAVGAGVTEDRLGNRQPAAAVRTGAPAADAVATVRVRARLSLSHARGSRTVAGRVRTTSPCHRRVVRVLQAGRRVARGRTSATGRFAIRLRGSLSGRLRVRVTAKAVVRNGVAYGCAAATSRRVGA